MEAIMTHVGTQCSLTVITFFFGVQLCLQHCSGQLMNPNPIFPQGSYINDPFSSALRRYAFRGFRGSEYSSAVSRAPWVLRCRGVNEKCAIHAQCCSYYCGKGFCTSLYSDPHLQKFVLDNLIEPVPDRTTWIHTGGATPNVQSRRNRAANRQLFQHHVLPRCPAAIKHQYLDAVRTYLPSVLRYDAYVQRELLYTDSTLLHGQRRFEAFQTEERAIQLLWSNQTERKNCIIHLGLKATGEPPYYYAAVSSQGLLIPRGALLDVLHRVSKIYSAAAGNATQVVPSVRLHFLDDTEDDEEIYSRYCARGALVSELLPRYHLDGILTLDLAEPEKNITSPWCRTLALDDIQKIVHITSRPYDKHASNATTVRVVGIDSRTYTRAGGSESLAPWLPINHNIVEFETLADLLSSFRFDHLHDVIVDTNVAAWLAVQTAPLKMGNITILDARSHPFLFLKTPIKPQLILFFQ